METIPSRIRKYFLITFAWTWSIWCIPGLMGMSINESPTMIFLALGGFAPSLVGTIMAYKTGDSKYWKDYLKRIIDYKRITPAWLLVILLTIPVSAILSSGIYWGWTGNVPEFSRIHEMLKNPVSLVMFALFMMLFGPIPEEIGWRGFALDHLNVCYTRVRASIILGAFWALWHVPLFFIGDTYQQGLYNQSFILVVDYLLQFFVLSIIMDWIYHNTGKSILSGVLFHFCINFFGELFELPAAVIVSRTLVQLVFALGILYFWRGNDRTDIALLAQK